MEDGYLSDMQYLAASIIHKRTYIHTCMHHAHTHTPSPPKAEVDDVSDIWREDLVSFLLGCSFSWEQQLADAGHCPRHLEVGGGCVCVCVCACVCVWTCVCVCACHVWYVCICVFVHAYGWGGGSFSHLTTTTTAITTAY